MSREQFPKRKLKGVNVPDTLVTVNDIDSYKLLDAPNIDWDEYLMKWTNIIYKFNSSGNTTEENELNNKNDWYTPAGKFNDGQKPSWANGVIKDSEQVLDMIDYLMYRVANIDYFVDNWNLRDSAKTSLLFVCYNLKFLTNENKVYLESIGAEYENQYLIIKTTGNVLQVLLPVTMSSDNYTYLTATGFESDENYISYFGNEIPLSDTKFFVFSNSKGKLSIENTSEGIGDTIDISAQKIPPIDISEVGFLTELPNSNTGWEQADGGDKQFINPFKLKIYGTDSWFYNLEEISNAILANTNSFADINNQTITNLDDYKIDPRSNQFSFSIRQAADKVANIQYGETIQTLTLNVKKNNISDKVRLIINGNTSNNAFTTIPFFNEILSDNKYSLTFLFDQNNFNITNQNYKDYGLYPTFFIKDTSDNDNAIGKGTFDPFSENGFNSFTNEFGKIYYDNGEYWFEPPKEDVFLEDHEIPQDGYKITIYCLLYYKNGTSNDGENPRLRSFQPIFIKTNVKLKSKEKNKIIFLTNTNSRIAYRWNNSSNSYVVKLLEIDQPINNTSRFLDNNKIYYSDDESVIEYAVKDIYYDKNDYNYSRFNNITIPNVLTSIGSSVWSDDVKIEFYGVANQTSLKEGFRTFDLENGKCNIDGIDKNIIKERYYKLGEDYQGKSIYYDYVDDIDPTYYTLDTSNDLLVKDENALNDEKYFDKDKLNNDILNTIYKPLSQPNDYIQNYGPDSNNIKLSVNNSSRITINTTSAIFPDKNGLVSTSSELSVNNGKINITNEQVDNEINYSGDIYDADNDYVYLVFRIYCEEGIEPNGGITYSACEAYYFLRILRYSKPYSLVFKTNNIINYTIGNDNYNMKLITRSPIYLNRLLTDEAITHNQDILGKQYWYFYGSNKYENTSNTWNDNIIAIDNGYYYYIYDTQELKYRDPTEKYLYIYNEGDVLPITNSLYSDKISQSNPNYILSQNNWYYDLHSNDYSNISANKIQNNNRATTGAILYIDKLMRLKDSNAIFEDENETENNHFTAVGNNSININIGIIVGNSDIYNRVKSSTIGTILISKRIYDINLYLYDTLNGNDVLTEVVSSNSKPINLTVIPENENNVSITNFISALPNKAFNLISDEFSDKNAQIRINDVVEVNPDTTLTLPDSDIQTSIRFESGNVGTWFIDESSTRILLDKTKDVNVYYFKSEDSSQNRYFHGRLYFGGMNITSIPYLIRFTISADEQGIYTEKTISNYFIVSNS